MTLLGGASAVFWPRILHPQQLEQMRRLAMLLNVSRRPVYPNLGIVWAEAIHQLSFSPRPK